MEHHFQFGYARRFAARLVLAALLVTAAGCAGLMKPAAPPPPPGSLWTNPAGLTFAYIPAGRFYMGSPLEEPGRAGDETRRLIEITRGFYLQTTEVTQSQWRAVMGDNPSYFNDCGPDCPVEKVSHTEALEYISRLNELDPGSDYRLPTEAEWEYACRAGTDGPLYLKPDDPDLADTADVLDRIAWYGDNSYGPPGRGEDCFQRVSGDKAFCGTHPVGRKEPNAWGLYDLLGNVSEWCWDWYSEYLPDQVEDPQGPPLGSARVMRGGDWLSAVQHVRAANRDHFSPGGRGFGIGFRVLREY